MFQDKSNTNNLKTSENSDFMGYFGNDDNLTPELDRLAQNGIVFTNFYATGTRTVRGLEAITLAENN